MKKGRIISILLLVFVLGLLFINRDKLVSFAQEDNINLLGETPVVKNGTSFLLDNYAEFDGMRENCVYIVYHKEDYTTITGKSYCVNSSDPTKHVVIDNDYAEYWGLVSIYQESYGFSINFMPYEYKAPEYKLDCAPNKITMDTYATCTVTAETYYNISNIEFDLALDDFVIYDEVKLEDVENFNKNEHHYVLSPSHIDYDYGTSSDTTLLPFKDPVTLKLMQFKIKTEKEQEVAVLGNIKLNNLIYNDISGNASYVELTSTVGQDKNPEAMSETEEEKHNPETVDMIIIAAVLLVISATIIFVINFRNKKMS